MRRTVLHLLYICEVNWVTGQLANRSTGQLVEWSNGHLAGWQVGTFGEVGNIKECKKNVTQKRQDEVVLRRIVLHLLYILAVFLGSRTNIIAQKDL